MRLLLQSDMCGTTLDEVIEFHIANGVTALDLKTGLAGEPIELMSRYDAAEARRRIDIAGLEVYCLSTSLFAVEAGSPTASAARDHKILSTLAPLFNELRPRFVRVLAGLREQPGTGAVDTIPGIDEYLVHLRSSAASLAGAGIGMLIENGPDRSILSSPADVVEFFALLRAPSAGFIWDVQNMWQSLTFPEPSAVDELAGVLKYLHVKGGRTADGSTPGDLVYASTLADASWPVAQILSAVRDLGSVEFVALNPSHGDHAHTSPESIRQADIDYLRQFLAQPTS